MKNARNSFSDELKWNVCDLYKDLKEFDKDYCEVEKKIAKINEFRGHLMESPEKLYEYLQFYYELLIKMERLYIYAHIQNDQDTSDVSFQALFSKARKLFEQFNEQSAFVYPEILKSDYDAIENFIASYEPLKPYERTLKEMFKYKNHTLSESEEKLLSQISSAFKTPDDVYSLLCDADLRFGIVKDENGEEVELTEKNYRSLSRCDNREVRKQVFETFMNTYGNFKNTYAKLLSSEVSNNNKISKVRKFKSALASSLFSYDIDENIYLNLIDSVKKNIAPLSKYWNLKRKVLKLDDFHIYDTYAPITKSSEKKYSVEEAKDMIISALKILGEDYVKNLNLAFEQKWIDFCPNDGKRNGAYCTSCYDVHPYVLVNYDNSFENISTLAHELGHAIHYYYANTNQPIQDHDYSIFVAEVASQVNQILLSKYMIDNTNDIEEKKYLIDDLISDFKATIIRQTMFADFEYQIHELEANGEYLSWEVISNLYYKLNKEYFGENIIIDECIKYEWERIPHFYMNFYVYQYATAYAASIKIAFDILNGKDGAKEKYLEFLKLGSTKSPIDSLKVANVDMTGSTVIDESFKYFENLIEELDNIMNGSEK